MQRRISWMAGALKAFRKFPAAVQENMTTALQIAARGGKAEVAKPMKGLGSGVFEISLAFRGSAYRSVYAVKAGKDIYVLHAFQKKSPRGIATPQKEINLIKRRLKRVEEGQE